MTDCGTPNARCSGVRCELTRVHSVRVRLPRIAHDLSEVVHRTRAGHPRVPSAARQATRRAGRILKEAQTSARYYDAGSGPHDPGSQTNDKGERNCGCRKEGMHWANLCAAASKDHKERHEAAMLEYYGYEI